MVGQKTPIPLDLLLPTPRGFYYHTAAVSKVKTNYTDDTDFDPEKVKKGSVAAAGLCKWVHAMVVYNRVAKVVGPKREALVEAESTLAQAMAELSEKQAMLKVGLAMLLHLLIEQWE